MKASTITFLLVSTLFLARPVAAESSGATSTAFMGVVLDWRHLPEMLTKHLGLAPGKGRRIENIYAESPADKAGLERDDILVAFQGQDVNDVRDFGDALVKAGVGKLVFLDVIHAGQHKTVRLTLGARPADPRRKYPPSYDGMGGLRMGDFYRQGTDGRWIRVEGADANGLPPFFPKEVYTFTYDQTVVTVEGNPRVDASTVVVRTGQAEYKTTLGQLDKLPATYRDLASQAIKQARQDSERTSRIFGPSRGPGGRDGGRGRSGPPQGDRMGPDGRGGEGAWQQDHMQRVLDGITRYIEGLQQSPKPMQKPDMDRLKLIEEQLHQIQDKIDQIQKSAPQDSNRPSHS